MEEDILAHRELSAPDPLSPARVEAMAREYCRIMGLDADAPVCPQLTRKNWESFKGQVREFIAMHLAYERTKG